MAKRGRTYVYFLIGLAAIIAGFWRTFFGDPFSNDAWHNTHGVASTLWVLLLITQSLLIGRGYHGWHRRLGWASLVLFVALIGTSSYMVWIELRGDPDFPRNLRLSLVFLDVGFLVLFVATYAAGLWLRRDRALHARLMGSTILIGLGPALGVSARSPACCADLLSARCRTFRSLLSDSDRRFGDGSDGDNHPDRTATAI